MNASAQIMVVDGREDLQTLLEEHGVDLGGRKAIPLCIPINSLDEIPVALRNLSEHADKISTQISDAMRREEEEGAEVETLREKVEELRRNNVLLQARLDGVSKALGITL